MNTRQRQIPVSVVFGQNCSGREVITFPYVDRHKIYYNKMVGLTIIELSDRCFSTYLEPNRVREILYYNGNVTYCESCRGTWAKHKPCVNTYKDCTCCDNCREQRKKFGEYCHAT